MWVYEMDLSSNLEPLCKSHHQNASFFSVSSSNSSHIVFFSQPVLVTCEFWPETSNLLFCVKTYTLRNPSNHCPIRRPNYIVSIKVFPFSSSSPKNLQKPSSISSLFRVANRNGGLLLGFAYWVCFRVWCSWPRSSSTYWANFRSVTSFSLFFLGDLICLFALFLKILI